MLTGSCFCYFNTNEFRNPFSGDVLTCGLSVTSTSAVPKQTQTPGQRKKMRTPSAEATGLHSASHPHPSASGIQVCAVFRQAAGTNSSMQSSQLAQGALESLLKPPQAAHQVKMEAMQHRWNWWALSKAGTGSQDIWTSKMSILVENCTKGCKSISVSQSWSTTEHSEDSSFHKCLRMPCLTHIHLYFCTFGRCGELIRLISYLSSI